MSLPDWIEKYKRPKTEIQFKNYSYYMYSVSYKYSPEKKRTIKISGKLLGKITEKDGFIQSAKDKLRESYAGTISVAEYGCTQLFLSGQSRMPSALSTEVKKIYHTMGEKLDNTPLKIAK